jgi:hypothetical protein
MLFEAVDITDRATLDNLYEKESLDGDSVIKVLEMLNKYKIQSLIESKMSYYKKQTTESLKSLSLDPDKTACFGEIIDWLLPGVKS